eukprot:516187-Amphidinium_carterae.1
MEQRKQRASSHKNSKTGETMSTTTRRQHRCHYQINTMKTMLLLQHMQGDIRPHLLLNTNTAQPDFNKAATTMEDYYRNVYIDNNSTGTSGLKGKYGNGKHTTKTEPLYTEKPPTLGLQDKDRHPTHKN